MSVPFLGYGTLHLERAARSSSVIGQFMQMANRRAWLRCPFQVLLGLSAQLLSYSPRHIFESKNKQYPRTTAEVHNAKNILPSGYSLIMCHSGYFSTMLEFICLIQCFIHSQDEQYLTRGRLEALYS
ncbi:hypothetical protein Y032_0494g2444 [Ancylostoma ceylanicum]|uniref:Uncharacterized protein n=1 Tax=Ancylostoma ceylanicum TaxID=53326 RepID=A0A016WUB9_9BILA|nr:hypothetical protein Y032_0494g2444 [Ancylostoma ceylanicum]